MENVAAHWTTKSFIHQVVAGEFWLAGGMQPKLAQAIRITWGRDVRHMHFTSLEQGQLFQSDLRRWVDSSGHRQADKHFVQVQAHTPPA